MDVPVLDALPSFIIGNETHSWADWGLYNYEMVQLIQIPNTLKPAKLLAAGLILSVAKLLGVPIRVIWDAPSFTS